MVTSTETKKGVTKKNIKKGAKEFFVDSKSECVQGLFSSLFCSFAFIPNHTSAFPLFLHSHSYSSSLPARLHFNLHTTTMLRSSQEKADRRAAKTQSLYVATPSSFSGLPPHLQQQQQQQLQSFQPSFPSGNHTISSPLNSNNNTNNTTGSGTPKSPRKSRPFSMMFLHPQDELAKQQQHHIDSQQLQALQEYPLPPQQQQQQQQQLLNESDEDATTGDGQSLTSTVIDYGESDLKDVDSDTRMLIAHLSDLDVKFAKETCGETKKLVHKECSHCSSTLVLHSPDCRSCWNASNRIYTRAK